jgi:hypothetical protein
MDNRLIFQLFMNVNAFVNTNAINPSIVNRIDAHEMLLFWQFDRNLVVDRPKRKSKKLSVHLENRLLLFDFKKNLGSESPSSFDENSFMVVVISLNLRLNHEPLEEQKEK